MAKEENGIIKGIQKESQQITIQVLKNKKTYRFRYNNLVKPKLEKLEIGTKIKFKYVIITTAEGKKVGVIQKIWDIITKEETQMTNASFSMNPDLTVFIQDLQNMFKSNKPPKQSEILPIAKKNKTFFNVPNDTQKVLNKKGFTLKDNTNYLLSITKFQPFHPQNKGKPDKADYYYVDKSMITLLNIPPKDAFRIIQKTSQKIERLVKYFHGRSWKGALASRLAIGLGGTAVQENSLTLHFIYGYPIIPGQAIKGVTRSYILDAFFDNDEMKAMKDQGFRLLFGFTSDPNESSNSKDSASGHVSYMDAYPIDENTKVSLDVMTPHYSSYYKGKQMNKLTDSENPIPLTFISVEKAIFNFSVIMTPGIQKVMNDKPINSVITNKNEKSNWQYTELLDVAEYYVKKALTNNGIGAKTQLGYGRFHFSSLK